VLVGAAAVLDVVAGAPRAAAEPCDDRSAVGVAGAVPQLAKPPTTTRMTTPAPSHGRLLDATDVEVWWAIPVLTTTSRTVAVTCLETGALAHALARPAF
jgi:hypothetical protein